MKTTPQFAAELGISIKTVQKWCRYLGYRPQGRDILLTEERQESIRRLYHDKPGRPAK